MTWYIHICIKICSDRDVNSNYITIYSSKNYPLLLEIRGELKHQAKVKVYKNKLKVFLKVSTLKKKNYCDSDTENIK